MKKRRRAVEEKKTPRKFKYIKLIKIKSLQSLQQEISKQYSSTMSIKTLKIENSKKT